MAQPDPDSPMVTTTTLEQKIGWSFWHLALELLEQPLIQAPKTGRFNGQSLADADDWDIMSP